MAHHRQVLRLLALLAALLPTALATSSGPVAFLLPDGTTQQASADTAGHRLGLVLLVHQHRRSPGLRTTQVETLQDLVLEEMAGLKVLLVEQETLPEVEAAVQAMALQKWVVLGLPVKYV